MAHFRFVHLFLFVVFCSILWQKIDSLSCLNEFGHKVDWFVLYKIPRLRSSPKPFNTGKSYVYFTSDMSKHDNWKLSPYLINQDKSILAQALNQLYRNPRNYTYVQYNDEPPISVKRLSVQSAHAKGVLALGESTGFWLIHSIPKFPSPLDSSYSFPSSGTIYGQTVLCVTLDTPNQADHVLQQLLVMRPTVYASGQSEQVSVFNWDAVVSGHWSNLPRETLPIQSVDNQRFISIVKSPLGKFELYSDQVAPLLSTDLLVETWRNGIGGKLNSSCDTKFKVNNIANVRLDFELAPELLPTLALSATTPNPNLFNKLSQMWRKRFNRPAYDQLTDRSVQWPSTDDHSKWAVSSVAGQPFICIGDMNRMQSQMKRGGGTLCYRNTLLWKLFFNSISEIEPCPISTLIESTTSSSSSSSSLLSSVDTNTTQSSAPVNVTLLHSLSVNSSVSL